MDKNVAQPAQDSARELLHLEFRGSGSEYFRIWIVNLALTLLTLGIYGAWAKVRTWRYFYGNTYLGDHSFEYHASPVRILIGRLIALALFLSYSLTINFYPMAAPAWIIVLFAALPWLANASIRFNARNSSYRNVRFNFTGSYGEALVAYVLWPIGAALTLYLLWPRARKARDYYYVNRHTFGGRPFETEFSTWSIYKIYLVGLLILIVVGGAIGSLIYAYGFQNLQAAGTHLPKEVASLTPFAVGIATALTFIIAGVYIETMVFNLTIGNAKLDGRHELRAELSPLAMAWLYVTNTFLTLITIGIFYPWAAVRLARYRRSRIKVLAATNLNEFTSEIIATQGAIGEEIAGFFDLGFGL